MLVGRGTGRVPGLLVSVPRMAVEAAPITNRIVAYPSRVLRPIPGFVFAAPEGWVLDEAPDALAVLRSAEEVDGFWPNAIISHDRVASSIDLETAAKASAARLEQATPGVTVQFERLARFGPNVVYLRGVELPAPQSGRKLAQIHGLFFAPAPEGAKTTDLFQFVATATPEAMAELGTKFVEMIASFRFV